MPPLRNCLLPLLALGLFVWSLTTFSSFAQESSSSDRPTNPQSVGKGAYNTACGGCHGLDGRGSDKAADISGSANVRHLSDAQLSTIIANGMPGTGMPAFRNLSEKQRRAVISYLRSLQGKFEARVLPGDAGRGKQIFFGKGECSSCHMVSGEGGFLGPDLSVYGSTASSAAIRDEIVKANRIPPPGYRSAVLVTSEGDRVEGVIRNEDNFSVQFQSKDGGFHLYQKSDLRSLDRLETSMMPTDYWQRLSAAEINDLTGYLMTASPDTKTGTLPKKQDDFE